MVFKRGWIMTVGQDGTFLGRLQVEQVDINRSIGRVTLEDPSREVSLYQDLLSMQSRDEIEP